MAGVIIINKLKTGRNKMEEIEKESDSMDDNPSNEDDLDELFEQDDKQVMPAVVADPQVLILYRHIYK